MTKIAVIILNWNQPKLTFTTITSLKKTKSKNFTYHIFLIDNGSSNNSKNLFNHKYSKDPKVTLHYLPNNLGFAGGNNVGIELALKRKFNYILLLNNDTIVDPKFLIYLVNTLLEDKSIGIVGPKIYFAPGFEFHKDRYSPKDIGKVIWSAGGLIDWNNIIFSNRGIDEIDHGQYDRPTSKIDKISGCCALIPSDVFETIGLLDNDLYLYNEDDDFCQRLVKAGYRLYYQPKSFIWHLNSGSSSSGGGLLHDYFMTRNRLVFGFRYASIRTKFALFRDSLRLLLFGYRWQKIGVIDFYRHRLGKGSWK